MRALSILQLALLALVLSVCADSVYGKRDRVGAELIIPRFNDLAHLRLFWSPSDSLELLSAQDAPIHQPSELEMEYRIAEMNRHSPIPMRYHPIVGRYISIFTQERKSQVEMMMGLSELYFPIFREALDRHHMPLELVYLAVVESALNPLAVSKSGAVGLWQFKINTAEMLGLKVDSFTDDRMDPRMSTEAACAYLEYLYKVFDDWLLALAAYNIGPGAVQRVIERRNGERDYWRLLPHMPEAARNYVPAFIAAHYVFKHAKESGLTAVRPEIDFKSVDTIHITQPLSFKVLAEWTGTPLKLIHFLNPRFRQGYIPASEEGDIPITLPAKATHEYAKHQARIHAQSFQVSENRFAQADEKSLVITHAVLPGEYLHKIAIRYGCTVTEIQQWNGLSKDIYPGQELTIRVTPSVYAKLQQQGELTE